MSDSWIGRGEWIQKAADDPPSCYGRLMVIQRGTRRLRDFLGKKIRIGSGGGNVSLLNGRETTK